MGSTIKHFIVKESRKAHKKIEVEFLIDSGAVYSLVPAVHLKTPGIKPYKTLDLCWWYKKFLRGFSWQKKFFLSTRIMKHPKYIPEIRPSVFWDVPKEDIDYTKYSDFIICRVFNYGNFQEIADVIVCYGKEYVKEVLLNSTELDVFGLLKASVFLAIPETQFLCYSRKPWPLHSWRYFANWWNWNR